MLIRTWGCLALCFAVAACGGAPTPRPATESDLRPLGDGHALSLIERMLREAHTTPSRNVPVDVGGTEPVVVDFQLGVLPYGVLWVTPEDRANYGALLPPPDSDGQLRIVAGARADAALQVLVLDHRTYRYDPDPERVRAGAFGVREAEARLRRDVADFIEYVRGQGAL